MKTSILATTLSASLLLAGGAHATPLVYESYDGYNAGQLSGQTATRSGITGNYSGSGVGHVITAQGGGLLFQHPEHRCAGPCALHLDHQRADERGRSRYRHQRQRSPLRELSAQPHGVRGPMAALARRGSSMPAPTPAAFRATAPLAKAAAPLRA